MVKILLVIVCIMLAYQSIHKGSQQVCFYSEVGFAAYKIYIVSQVDVPRLIMCKLLPAGIQHLDDFLGIQQWAKSSGISIDSASLQYIGTRMHPAAFNREMELSYLRQLTNLLLPHLMPNYHLNCRSVQICFFEDPSNISCFSIKCMQ